MRKGQKHSKKSKKRMSGKNHPLYGKHRSEKVKRKISKSVEKLWQNDEYKKKNAFHKHHIYMEKNSDKTITLTKSKHLQLHARTYEYLYHKYGEKGIDNYIKWFDKEYGLEE